MKTATTFTLCSTFLLAASGALAHGSAGDAALGGALGGATGALIGNQIGGRDGAIIGGALGAAGGVYVLTERGRRVEYVPTPVYVAPRPVAYYGPRVVYVEKRGHGRYKHHHKDWDDRDDWHEGHHGRHHWD